MAPAPGWSDIVPELGPETGRRRGHKHQPSAFFGTDLDIHLRRRGITTIVLCGISTNIGVEATARTGFEHGYNLVFASDAMTARDAELHTIAVTKYFPTIGRVRTTGEIFIGPGIDRRAESGSPNRVGTIQTRITRINTNEHEYDPSGTGARRRQFKA